MGAAAVRDLEGALVEIEGCNGKWWPVSGPNQWSLGVALADEDTGTDFDGMYEPPVTTLYNSTAFQIGADFDGIREEKYDFILAIHVIGTADKHWRTIDSEFRKSFSFKRDTKIWVEVEGSRRSLRVRLGAKPKIKAVNDPNSEQYGLILLPLVGPYPRWIETPRPSLWVTTHDTTGGGTETGFVWVGNPLPEDYDAYPVWEIQSGAAGMVVTLPDYSWGSDSHERATEDALRRVQLAPLLAGEHLLVNTDPLAMGGQFVSSLDTEFAGRMNGVRLVYPIPGGTPRTQLPITVTGAPIGTGIRVTVPRDWPRPWGLD